MTPFYDRDGITIYHGDCRDVLPSIDPADVDLLLTDPPYGINLATDYSGMTGSTHRAGTGGGKRYAPVAGDDEPFDPAPLLRYQRLLLFGANHFATRLPEGGRWIVWRKRGASQWLAAAELAWHNCGGRPVDYFETTYNRARAVDGHLHPTQKPTELMRWIVDRWTQPGDLVLDPYMGSGPVAQACHELGRRYIGVELVEDYCRIAVSRLAQQTLDLDGAAS